MESRARYPHTPGYAAGSSTSHAAAVEIRGELKALHRDVMCVLRDRGALTADEIASQLKRHILTIRPRLTELRELGYVERTADTRPSALGNGQHVLRLTDVGHDALEDRTDALHSPNVAAPAADVTGQTLLNFPL